MMSAAHNCKLNSFLLDALHPTDISPSNFLFEFITFNETFFLMEATRSHLISKKKDEKQKAVAFVHLRPQGI